MYQEINLYVPRTMHRSKLPDNLVIKLFNDLIGQPLKAIFQRWFIRGIISHITRKSKHFRNSNEKRKSLVKKQAPVSYCLSILKYLEIYYSADICTYIYPLHWVKRVRTFPHSSWIRRKYGPEKLQIRSLFPQCH